MTGTGVSIITSENDQSYNSAVYKINQHQKDNVSKLESALNNANRNNEQLSKDIAEINKAVTDLNKQIFINQCLIDNWNNSPPYTYPVELLS